MSETTLTIGEGATVEIKHCVPHVPPTQKERITTKGEESLHISEGVVDQYSEQNSPFKSTETTNSVETPMDNEIYQSTKEIDCETILPSTPADNTTVDVLQIAQHSETTEDLKDFRSKTTSSLEYFPVKDSAENLSLPKEPILPYDLQPPLRSAISENATNEPNEGIGRNIIEGVLDLTLADKADTALFKERNEDNTGMNSELNLESTFIETCNGEEILEDENTSKAIRSSFTDRFLCKTEIDTLFNHVGEYRPIDKAEQRRSAVIESFSPISKTNDTSQDTSLNSTKTEDIISGIWEGDVVELGQSVKQHEATLEFDINEETESFGIVASSCVGIKSYNFSPLVSPIDTNSKISSNKANDPIKSYFLSPTTNPLNQTFKLLPETGSSTAEEDSDNISQDELAKTENSRSEVLQSRNLFTRVLNDVKSSDSVYYDCVPNSFHDSRSPTVHGHFEKEKLKETFAIDVQEVAEAIDVCEVDMREKIQNLNISSSDDSGTESPGLTNENLSPRVLLKDITGFNDKYTGSNVASTPNDKNKNVRYKCQSLTTASLEEGTRPESETVPASFSSAHGIQSKLATKIEIPSLEKVYNRIYNGNKLKFFEDLTESEVIDELDNNRASAILQDDTPDIGDVLVSSERNGHYSEQLMARLPLKDDQVLKQQTTQGKPRVIKGEKPQISKKANPSMTQGGLHAKQAAKPQAKTSAVLTKKPFIAGEKGARDVRELVKPTSASSQLIKKKEPGTITSSKPVYKKPTQTGFVTPVAKPTLGTRAPSAATTSSRITSTTTSGGKHGSASLLAKPSVEKTVVSSTSTKSIGVAKSISRLPRTAKQPQKQVDPLKSFMEIAQKVPPSPTTQRRQIPTSQGLRQNATYASSKPFSAQAKSKPTFSEDTTKLNTTVAVKRSATKPVSMASQKTKVNQDK